MATVYVLDCILNHTRKEEQNHQKVIKYIFYSKTEMHSQKTKYTFWRLSITLLLHIVYIQIDTFEPLWNKFFDAHAI